MTECAYDTDRNWFERGYMAAYADSLADGKPIPLSDDLLDRAWERQDFATHNATDALIADMERLREAVAGAFVTANSGGGKYEISMKVHDMATLHTLHDAILKVGRICAGE